MDRELDHDGGSPALAALDPDPTPVRLDDSIGDGEPEPGSLPYRLGREKGVEDLAHDLLRDAGAVVGHLDAQDVVPP